MLTKKQFENLFNTHIRAVSTLLSYYTSDKTELEDWVQEVFIKVWDNREKIDPGHPRVKGYLLKMARNHALCCLREQKREPFFAYDKVDDIPVPVHSVHGQLVKKELSQAYREALEQVPPRAKQAFTLSRDKGLTYSQIAEEMGISPKTVEGQISHTLKILRVELSEFRG
ncbi:RNA polymerase sigma-70 factor, ECF subfamily [Fodinibius roseus]|uniref:RNA polymerase sigma-70 factor, ECF subfamily n=1 Tax=Fodinibius roseus TaxID=1194090 RepID=A0A1M4V4I8_9BACT|nr:sigma-70 family RNA polymerase sigma factor [Fodinibius roseus]SHE63798.1 RNA polymerase sigma-70 factor, ECF subfamily [Fodinibius roseus]